ncbi:flagellar basal body P-ring formation chaperone FlgA [Thalassolituus sp. UBA6592]|uniref:flagellar basal body P-ring formation chaperone FlgA n=1 Tax=Thalassolituus sp. UBA6592 TaxID=1947665 RepID=UPI0025DF28FE|nr:flagellar basal body P-ring formation chaperone FlgA [Thalassolituus sp. UBA6592]|tara:strand:- start:1884 stop:2567 length:684 start_codon:yes stop_codon:yes gene_type:complete
MHRIITAFLALALTAPAFAAAQNDWQQTVSRQLLKRWQEISGDSRNSKISFPGTPSDFRLQDCDSQPLTDLVKPLQPGRNGIEIHCPSPYWSRHMAIQLHVYREVAVLAHSTTAGVHLTSADIRYVRHDIGELNKGFFGRNIPLRGLQVKRSLRAGTVLSPDMLDEPLIIGRGDEVDIRVNRPGISVTMKGTAMGRAREGETLRVKNNRSGKIVTATAIAPGLVQVE